MGEHDAGANGEMRRRNEIVIGRIYRELVPAGVKWRWFLHIMGASPNSGSADTLDQATAELATCYEINR